MSLCFSGIVPMKSTPPGSFHIWNYKHSGVQTDEFGGAHFPQGMDGTRLFGKIPADFSACYGSDWVDAVSRDDAVDGFHRSVSGAVVVCAAQNGLESSAHRHFYSSSGTHGTSARDGGEASL